jgi:hypothetical protein
VVATKAKLIMCGLQLDGPVNLLQAPNGPKTAVVRSLGKAGFLVKEHLTVYFWKDRGITWEVIADEKAPSEL